MGTYVTNTGLMATYGGQFTLTSHLILLPEYHTAIPECDCTISNYAVCPHHKNVASSAKSRSVFMPSARY
ncbi:hypothetical protein E0K61_26505 [Escherichia coli]|nr:hypothetical protein E0K61_26505 [Escherichia coli]